MELDSWLIPSPSNRIVSHPDNGVKIGSCNLSAMYILGVYLWSVVIFPTDKNYQTSQHQQQQQPYVSGNLCLQALREAVITRNGGSFYSRVAFCKWFYLSTGGSKGGREGPCPPRRVGKHPECTKSRHFQTQNRKKFLGRGQGPLPRPQLLFLCINLI